MTDTITSPQVASEVSSSPVGRIDTSLAVVEVARRRGMLIEDVSQISAEVATRRSRYIVLNSQTAIEVAWTIGPVQCLTTPSDQYESLSTQYYVSLLNTSGKLLAIFNIWKKLSYAQVLNDVGEFQLEFDDDTYDDRLNLFGIDYIVEVYRSVPGCGLDWYVDFRGLCRKIISSISSDGVRTFVVSGFDFNDLLARRVVAYREGTIRAEKNCPAETAMKQYVDENCSGSATADLRGVATSDSVGVSGVIPGFLVEPDTGAGPIYTGVHAFDNLLDTIKEISVFSNMDFGVFWKDTVLFEFKVFVDQYGLDRTDTTINPSDGTNIYGNKVVVMSVEAGNVQQSEYTLSRESEKNVIFVLGKGTRSTRNMEHVSDPAETSVSPWNACEAVRSGTDLEFAYQLKDLGFANLKDLFYKESFEFVPMQQPNCLYGKHYALGDRITLRHGDLYRNKRITSVNTVVTFEQQEINIQFKDSP